MFGNIRSKILEIIFTQGILSSTSAYGCRMLKGNGNFLEPVRQTIFGGRESSKQSHHSKTAPTRR